MLQMVQMFVSTMFHARLALHVLAAVMIMLDLFYQIVLLSIRDNLMLLHLLTLLQARLILILLINILGHQTLIIKLQYR